MTDIEIMCVPLSCRNTVLDYAVVSEHEECVQVLRERNGVTINEIKEMSALRIQTAYRAYRYYSTHLALSPS